MSDQVPALDPWDEPPKPWERQPGETSKAFAAFVAWRDMGPERSVRLAAESLSKSRQVLVDWASKNKWRPRLDAWERELDRRKTESQLAAVEEMGLRHARGALLLFKAATDRAQQLAEDPSKLKPADVARMFAVAVDVERKARGEPDKLEVDHKGAAPSAIDGLLETIRRMGAHLTAPTFSPLAAAPAPESDHPESHHPDQEE